MESVITVMLISLVLCYQTPIISDLSAKMTTDTENSHFSMANSHSNIQWRWESSRQIHRQAPANWVKIHWIKLCLRLWNVNFQKKSVLIYNKIGSQITFSSFRLFVGTIMRCILSVSYFSWIAIRLLHFHWNQMMIVDATIVSSAPHGTAVL